MTAATGDDGVRKWLLAVSPDEQWDVAATETFQRWADAALEQTSGLVGAETDVLAKEPQGLFTGDDRQPRFCAFLSLWVTVPFDPASLGAPAGASVAALEVQDRLRHDFPLGTMAGAPTQGVKKTSLWHAAPTCIDWRARYGGHATVVWRSHRSAWRYRQNIVVADPDGLGFDGVSELWWPDQPALLERFYASDEDRAAVKADTVFVERGKSVAVVTVHTVVVEPPRPQNVPRWVPE